MKCTASNKTITQKIKQESIAQAVDVMLIFFATYLGDKRGWKPERIAECLKWVQKMATMTTEDYVSLESARYDLVKYYGILFENGEIYKVNDEFKEKWLKEHKEE